MTVTVDAPHADVVEFDRLYGRLLAEYWHPSVEIHGISTTVFDYARMKQDAKYPDSLFNRTLQAIKGVDSARLQEANETKAFWINAYNFAAMRLVIDHYPVDSIRSLSISLIRYPWSRKAIRIGNKDYSLKQIEKDILIEQFNDPRIVFAVSCAAVSCPDRTAQPFTGQRLDAQLDAMIRTFLENPGKGLRLDRDRRVLTLGWILEKDRQLFQNRPGGVMGFVLPYLERDVREWLEVNPVEIKYFEHDWTLNDLAQAD
ncbi:MAG: DUF547 domain-containing protein [Thiogranum sp.]|nr:DUF547 domain-containing protein [Thiogranum sp.]